MPTKGMALMAAIARHRALVSKAPEVEYLVWKDVSRRVIQRLPNGMVRLRIGRRNHEEIYEDVPEIETSTSKVNGFHIENAGFRPVRCAGTYVSVTKRKKERK